MSDRDYFKRHKRTRFLRRARDEEAPALLVLVSLLRDGVHRRFLKAPLPATAELHRADPSKASQQDCDAIFAEVNPPRVDVFAVARERAWNTWNRMPPRVDPDPEPLTTTILL